MADFYRRGQDGFSAWLDGAHEERSAVQSIPVQPVMQTHANTVLFQENGDGTLMAVRLMNPAADNLDLAYEAGGRTVAAIAPKVFMNCTNLRRVILPDGLRQIGEMAFSGCLRLESVTIPGSVQKVGTLAFAKCAELQRVRIEPGVVALGPSCFSKCAKLLRVDIPASVRSYGGGVFFGCGKELVLYGAEGTPAQQYAKMNGVAFDSQSWKEDPVLIYEEREDGALIVQGPREEAPRVLEIPSEICGRRVAEIAPKAFFACGTLERVTVGSGTERIGQSAFFGCQALGSVAFERGLQVIEDSAFAGCGSLTQVTLPWGLAQIGRMAFFGCQRLSFVKMPPTTRISDLAMDGCAPNLRVFGGVTCNRISI